MNYFEFYKLPIGFNPDQKLVKQQFYALSKQYHPDFYINEPQAKQDEVLELSTLNNKAFQVLKNPAKVLPYVLELKGVMVAGENYSLPQSFLMEMMEVNETIMDLQFDADAAKLAQVRSEVASIEEGIGVQIKSLAEQFDSATAEETIETILLDIKDLFYRNKYIQRIKESLAKL